MWALGAFDRTRFPDLRTNPTVELVQQAETFKEAVSWSLIDIQYPSAADRAAAIQNKAFIPENNLPLGVHAFKNRIFVSLPKWKDGVPITLGVVGKNEGAHPAIRPYPNWAWNVAAKCQGLTSVFRMDIDVCHRLWVMDSGVVDAENTVNQLCPPQIVIFNLETDKLVWRYTIPQGQVPGSSLLSNIVVEVLNNDCADAYAYLGDVFRYGVVVYSYKQNRSWRLTHSYFYPDPLASDYSIDNIQFQWVDGLFGMALSPPDDRGNTYLFFHPLSSYREFSVPTWVLRNESLGFSMNQFFQVEGSPRDISLAHSTGSAMSRDGILFYNLLSRSAVGCWNWRHEYRPENQEVLVQNNKSLSFPNDLRVDLEPQQSVWVLSNRLHRFLYDRLNPKEINFRILTASVKTAVEGTVCENVNTVKNP